MSIYQIGKYRSASHSRGFTLIEAIVTVAIIGIIASIGWSYYESEIRANARRDAVTALTAISQVLERCRTDVGDYSKCRVSQVAPSAANTKDAGYKCGMYTYGTSVNTTNTSYSVNSPNCTYSVIISISKAADAYTLTATKVVTNDSECASLSLDNLGRKNSTPAASYKGTPPDYHHCWGN